MSDFASKKEKLNLKLAAFACMGPGLVIMDVVIYSYLVASVFGPLFFSQSTPFMQLIFGYLALGTSYLVRPIGGLFFGYIGDKNGRITAARISIGLMFISTIGIGLLPTADKFPILAPSLLIFMRILKGFAISGEFSGSKLILFEYSNPNKKCFNSIFGNQTSSTIGVVLAVLIVYFFKKNMPEEDFLSYGWRIPFIISGLIGLNLFFIRRKLSETPMFKSLSSKKIEISISDLKPFKIEFFSGMGVYILNATNFYHIAVFFPTFLQTQLNYDGNTILKWMAIIWIASLPLNFAYAYICDRIKRSTALIYSFLFNLFIIPFIYISLIEVNKFIIFVPFILMILNTIMYTPHDISILESFPTKVRYRAFALIANLIGPIFGGAFVAISLILIKTTGNLYAHLLYIIPINLFAIVLYSVKLMKKINIEIINKKKSIFEVKF